MNKYLSVFLLAVVTSFSLQAQKLLDEFQSPDNPHYWKNKRPNAAYWQQDVAYSIQASIDEKTDIITGTEELTYQNNSPDTLHEVYFHLYQNAFQPGSYADKLNDGNQVHASFGKYEKQGLGTKVTRISIDRTNVDFTLDNTILKIVLMKPLLPGKRMTFSIDFNTYFDNGSMRRRMKLFTTFNQKHYDGVHWYPRICVYDSHFGWETAQHLGKEFYGDYGIYEVALTFAKPFVVEATGKLMNESEVLPKELRDKLDISNFKDKPWESEPSTIIADDGTKKTWKYKGINVHDFAFTADPTYRLGETSINGVRCIAICQEQHAARWQEAASFTAKVIDIYSRDFGSYAYPKMVVADARDGMEYPMLTLNGGGYPDYHFVIAHEVGHNWFFGMVGNNETYRAALDEGFTQFLTSWSLDRIDGKYPITWELRDKSNYTNKHTIPNTVDEGSIFNPYLSDAMSGNDEPLNTHSDAFNGALGHGGGYRLVYYKTATMLYNLQYVLGDELFTEAMKHYFSKWSFCHPYFEDFRTAITEYTHADLTWFFDQWLETTKTNDYAIQCVKKMGHKNGEYTYKITLKRKGRMTMPLDINVTMSDGSVKLYYIPNSYFQKKTNATVLPYWYGWDNLNDTYSFEVKSDKKVKDVALDTSHRMSDMNYLNNKTSGCVKLGFDYQVRQPVKYQYYRMAWRPDLWYNGIDGIKAGIHLTGVHAANRHQLELSLWGNTRIGAQPRYHFITPHAAPLSYILRYSHPLVHNMRWMIDSRWLDGAVINELGFQHELGRGMSWDLRFRSSYRKDVYQGAYTLYNENNPGLWHNTTTFTWKGNKSMGKSTANYQIGFRMPFIASSFNYSRIHAQWLSTHPIGKCKLKTRIYAQLGWGTFAKESMLNLAGANEEEMIKNKYSRAVGFLPSNWMGYSADYNHFQMGGGLNLRGYAGYVGPAQYRVDGTIRYYYQGTRGASVNAEFEFPSIGPKHGNGRWNLQSYLFGDVGMLSLLDNGLYYRTDIRGDAGLGLALAINKFWKWDDISPLVIRADFPVYLSTNPMMGAGNIAGRWVLGINRCF